MKNLLLAGLALASLSFATTACSDQKKTAETTTATAPAAASDSTATPAGAGTNTTTAVAAYTCTMHPEVTSDKPGKCPKCGMELVKK